jgi:hypothetical protein
MEALRFNRMQMQHCRVLVRYVLHQMEGMKNIRPDSMQEVGEITSQYHDHATFADGMATKLPIETKLYVPNPKKRTIYAR